MCKYTFLLPAFKAKYLSIAIESILSQTYKDFKLIVVDDASPEDLKSIVKSFSDDRISYIRNKINLGGRNLCDNWHHCLQYVSTEYMVLASDDDLYEKDFLEYVDKYTSAYPQSSVVRCNTRIINGKGEIEKEDDVFKTANISLAGYLLDFFQKQVRCIANTVYKTSWIKEHGYSVYDLAWHTDNMTAFKAAEDNGIILIGDKVLFNFRVSGINISSTNTVEYILRKSKASSLYFSELSKLIDRLPVPLCKRLSIRFQYIRTARLSFYAYLCNCNKGAKAIMKNISDCDLFRPIQQFVLLTIVLKRLINKIYLK